MSSPLVRRRRPWLRLVPSTPRRAAVAAWPHDVRRDPRVEANLGPNVARTMKWLTLGAAIAWSCVILVFCL